MIQRRRKKNTALVLVTIVVFLVIAVFMFQKPNGSPICNCPPATTASSGKAETVEVTHDAAEAIPPTPIQPAGPVPARKNLVIGMATRLDMKWVVPFVVSLRDHSPSSLTDLIILIDTDADDVQRFEELATAFSARLHKFSLKEQPQWMQKSVFVAGFDFVFHDH